MNQPITSNHLLLALSLPAACAAVADVLNDNGRGAIDRAGWIIGCALALFIIRRLRGAG